MNSENFLTQLQNQGYRITRVRRWLVEFFHSFDSPVSVLDVLARLKSGRIAADKTTLYRELAFLTDRGLTQEVKLPDGTIAYESKLGHHHHVVCKNCGVVAHIENESLEDDLAQAESQLKVKGFRDVEHELGFVGLCAECAS